MSTVDPNKAVEIVEKITNKGGLLRIAQEYANREKNIKNQISVLSGELAEVKKIQSVFQRLATEWGIADLETPEKTQTTFAQPEKIQQKDIPGAKKEDPEVARRVAKGLCLYKDREAKKWCQRKLKTKEQKKEGYCSAHLVELGLKKKRSSKRAKKSN